MKVSIVVPAYNEQDAVSKVAEAVKKVKGDFQREIILVDDGSSDRTYAEMNKVRGVKVLRHRKNKGKAAALETGFRNATGGIFITIDADDTYPADAIPELVREIERGNDLVIASRFRGKSVTMPKANYYGNLFFSWLIRVLTGAKITDGSSGMRALRPMVWKQVKVKARGLNWEVEMTTASIRKKFKVSEIPITYSDRLGSSKLNRFTDSFRFAFSILRARFCN